MTPEETARRHARLVEMMGLRWTKFAKPDTGCRDADLCADLWLLLNGYERVVAVVSCDVTMRRLGSWQYFAVEVEEQRMGVYRSLSAAQAAAERFAVQPENWRDPFLAVDEVPIK